jgi:uncharacterized protein (TIGR02996 family)
VDPLLERVLADPHDADLRAVWADALQERGDPRGEFIALQLQPPPLTPAQDKRLRSLISKHRVEWLGELDPIVQRREGLVFDRGVLAECQVQVKSVPALAKVVGHPLWATLRQIWFCDKFAWDPRILPVLVHPVMRELRDVICIGMNHIFPALARHPRPLPFTSIWTTHDNAWNGRSQFRELADTPGLPALKRFGCVIHEEDREWLLAHPVLRKIETLGITGHDTSAWWLERTRELENLETLEMRNWWIPLQGPQRTHAALYFTRGTKRRWSRLRIGTVTAYAESLLARELQDLPANSLERIEAPAALADHFKKFKQAELVLDGVPAGKPKRTR